MPTDLRHNHPAEAECGSECPRRYVQLAPTPDGGDAADPWRIQRRVVAAVTVAPPADSETPPGPRARLAEAEAEESRRSGLAGELEEWWLSRVHTEIEGVVPKAIEYSSTDLVDLGRQIANLAGWDNFSDAHLAELGIAFYVAGKVGRVMGAIKEGRLPSDDTWHDIAVYTKMAQRVRDVGAWPGV